MGSNPICSSNILLIMITQNICLNCKHFRIWDDDPCCLEPNGWKIVLPTETCDKYDTETWGPTLELQKEMWQESKKDFFDRYIISPELLENYLKYYPEDKDLINK